jgi:hypothetical protein
MRVLAASEEIALRHAQGDFEPVFKLRAAKVTLRRAQDDFCLYRKVPSNPSQYSLRDHLIILCSAQYAGRGVKSGSTRL